MIDDCEIVPDELFSRFSKSMPRIKKARRNRTLKAEDRQFAELKIRTAMKARGVSRETAVRQLKAEAKARAEEAARREAENGCPDW